MAVSSGEILGYRSLMFSYVIKATAGTTRPMPNVSKAVPINVRKSIDMLRNLNVGDNNPQKVTYLFLVLADSGVDISGSLCSTYTDLTSASLPAPAPRWPGAA